MVLEILLYNILIPKILIYKKKNKYNYIYISTIYTYIYEVYAIIYRWYSRETRHEIFFMPFSCFHVSCFGEEKGKFEKNMKYIRIISPFSGLTSLFVSCLANNWFAFLQLQLQEYPNYFILFINLNQNWLLSNWFIRYWCIYISIEYT